VREQVVLFHETGWTGPGRRSRLGCAGGAGRAGTAAGREELTGGARRAASARSDGLSRLTPYVSHAHAPRMLAVAVASRRPPRDLGTTISTSFPQVARPLFADAGADNAKPRAGCSIHLPLVNGAPTRGSNALTVRGRIGVVNKHRGRPVDDDVHGVGTARGVAVDDARTTCGWRCWRARSGLDDLRKRRPHGVDMKKFRPARGRNRRDRRRPAVTCARDDCPD